MSRATTRRISLREALRRRVFIVFVARERDMAVLRRGEARGWTVPSSARPGDTVVVYKPGESAGYAGNRRPPFRVFVAAGIVYNRPRRLGPRFFNASIAEVKIFRQPVPRAVLTEAFPEWSWLTHMRGELGVQVPESIAAELLVLLDRIAYRETKKTKTSPK